MRARGWAGEAWLPFGWPAGTISSPAPSEAALKWRRICFGTNPVRTLARVALWSTTILLTFHHFLVPIKVVGASMTPTYRDGSLNLVNRLAYSKRAPSRGDVVVIRDGHELILKRIVAVPGERVTLERGVFYINGVALHDQFTVDPINWDWDPTTLGPDEYFVIGDNRFQSVFGKFQRQAILGKIMF